VDPIVKRLIGSFQEILAIPELKPEGTLDVPEDSVGDIDVVAETFGPMFGMECPRSMRVGLGLPDTVSVRWQHDPNVSGEVNIVDLLGSMHSTFDPSLHREVIGGHRLGDLRIVDSVVVKAGPLHTVFEVLNGHISEQLYFFNARDLYPLELRYDAYLEMAGMTRAIVYWQYLFCSGRIAPPEMRVLAAGLDFLDARFPRTDRGELRERLRQRTS
jgi:hypothetical protein